jgi:hypothetical protein
MDWKVKVSRSCRIRGRDGCNAELLVGAILSARETPDDGGRFIHLVFDEGDPCNPDADEFRLTKATYYNHTRNGDLAPH